MLVVVLSLLQAPVTAVEEPAAIDPLRVHLDEMTPVVPRQGNVRISGTVTNTSEAEFTRINLHAFASSSPISDAPSLAASAVIAPEEYVGERITAPGTFDTLDVLAPGGTATFSLSIPVEELGIPRTPGVYWIGIHALGDSVEQPRDDFADGRARTFIPVLPEGRTSLEAAVVLPLRATIRYRPDGSVDRTRGWHRALADGGRLDRLLAVADAGSARELTWLVDPAVLDAIVRLSAGNPPRSLAAEPTDEGDEPAPEADPEAPETPDVPVPTVPAEPPGHELSPEERDLAAAATAWLERFVPLTRGQTVLALPYGDQDLSAAARHAPDRYQQAQRRSREVLADLEIPARPAVMPDNDVLTSDALRATSPETVVLLGDTAFAAPPTARNSVVRLLGRDVVVTSAGAQAGGPGPTAADDPLAMRQRLLSEAALRTIDGVRAPIVMSLPARWSPRNPEAFLSAFDSRWLSSVSVSDIADRAAPALPTSSLAYTAADQREELPASTFDAARRLTETGELLDQVLTLDTSVDDQVLDEALTTLSQLHRDDPAAAVRAADGAREEMTDQLDGIELEVPTAVTLSSNSGTLGATIINGLDQPVTVVLKADSPDGLTLRGPTERRLAAGARSLVRFEASATRPGVHDLRLEVTSLDGTPLGSSADLPVRATQVSGIIWFAMAAGAVLLFGAIGVRLWRQLRERRSRTEDPDDPDRDQPDADQGEQT